MKEWLTRIVYWVAVAHDELLRLNKAFGLHLRDKELHFLVMGVFGLLIFFAVHFCFVRLARKSITAISWIYTMTVMLVLIFAIEIGQYVTKTGSMDMADAVYGIGGCLCAFGVYAVGRTVWWLVWGRRRHHGHG